MYKQKATKSNHHVQLEYHNTGIKFLILKCAALHALFSNVISFIVVNMVKPKRIFSLCSQCLGFFLKLGADFPDDTARVIFLQSSFEFKRVAPVSSFNNTLDLENAKRGASHDTQTCGIT